MRNLLELNQYRVCDRGVAERYGSFGDDTSGVFKLKSPTGRVLFVIASSGEGWDHVSVSMPKKTPSWTDMEFVKRTFFKPDEAAFQLHVPTTDHISIHNHCLHLWRPIDAQIPLPPKGFV